MPARERQAQPDDALEIAVSDAGARLEPAREATVCVLPLPCPTTPEPDMPAAARDIHEIPEEPLAELPELEDFDDGDILLESSDVIEVEAARSGAGLDLLVDEDEQLLADDPPDDPPEALRSDADEGDDLEAPLAALGRLDLLALEGEDEDEEFDDGDAAEAEATEAPQLEAPDQAEPAPASPDPIRVPLWSDLNTFVYAFTRGVRGMGQSPLVQLLAVGTMAVCMLLLGTTVLIFDNAQRVAHDLGVDTPVTVYMQPDADPSAAAELRERIAALPEVAHAEQVTPEMALARLQEGLGQSGGLDDERAELLAGIDASVLPQSVEIELSESVEPGFADALGARIQAMEGVDEVAVLGPWVQQVEQMLTTLRWLAIGVAGLVSLACLAIVWSTIRLGVFARRSEIQILRLVGGTARFVRGPFVVEGVVQGVLGTALALACLWLSFELIRPFLERGMSLMFAAGSLHFFSVVEMVVALGFGALLGLIGSRAAVARHAEA
jgi:cell division protein FtsX